MSVTLSVDGYNYNERGEHIHKELVKVTDFQFDSSQNLILVHPILQTVCKINHSFDLDFGNKEKKRSLVSSSKSPFQ